MCQLIQGEGGVCAAIWKCALESQVLYKKGQRQTKSKQSGHSIFLLWSFATVLKNRYFDFVLILIIIYGLYLIEQLCTALEKKLLSVDACQA